MLLTRKRSAIVSIMFVDLPFLIIRSMTYYINSEAGYSHVQSFLLKNLLCLILQAVQLKTVQQVELNTNSGLFSRIGN